MWPENIPMLFMLPCAFAEHEKAREAWGAWGNHGLPMNSMLFPMLPIPGMFSNGEVDYSPCKVGPKWLLYALPTYLHSQISDLFNRNYYKNHALC